MNTLHILARVCSRLTVPALLCACAVLILCTPASAVMPLPAPKEKLSLPEPVAQAFETLIEAARSGKSAAPEVLDTVLAFSAGEAMGTGNRILPERPEGQGVFYYSPVPFSLTDVIAYTMDTGIPGAAIFPNSVRHGSWVEGSLRGDWNAFTLPAHDVTIAHAKEREEITPDANSGAYYAYTLNRLFALAPARNECNGTSALFQVSVQDGKSEIGLKGAILGPDTDWNYVYTGVQGSTLPMVGWAETYIYGAITINIWVESEKGQAYLYSYKWLNAGWSGMNMVKSSHINAGITRYLIGLNQVLGAAKRPSPDALKQAAARYAAMSDTEQITALDTFSRNLEQLAAAEKIKDDAFVKILKDGAYAAHLKREEREAELIKLFVKEQLGLPFSTAAH